MSQTESKLHVVIEPKEKAPRGADARGKAFGRARGPAIQGHCSRE